MRIEVGYGLEPLVTDALSSVIVTETILPRFRDGDMGGGVVAGAQALAEQLRLPLEAAEKRAQAIAAKKPKNSGYGAGDWMVAVFWIAVILFVLIPLMTGGRARTALSPRRGAGGGSRGPGWRRRGRIVLGVAVDRQGAVGAAATAAAFPAAAARSAAAARAAAGDGGRFRRPRQSATPSPPRWRPRSATATARS
ncbi:TPM domain-containing protein [Sphingomonas sp. MMS24-JH45]